MLTVTPKLITTGSAILLNIKGMTSDINVYRAPVVSGVIGVYVLLETVYTTNPNASLPAVILDMGTGLPGPLPVGYYVYQITDSTTGTILATTDILNLHSTLVLNRTDMTDIIVKLLRGGLQNIVLPGTFKRPQVYHAMPNTGMPPLPIISVNQSTFITEEVPIGQNVETYDMTNSWNIETIAQWTYMITVITSNAVEREFYRDLIISLLHSFMGTPFNNIGKNIRHSVMATSGQKNQDMNTPGFFWSDILFKFAGTFSIEIDNIPETILGITVSPTGISNGESVTDFYEVP